MSLKRLVIKKKIEDEVIEISEERLVDVEGTTNLIAYGIGGAVVVQTVGKFRDKAFRLKGELDWKIGIDDKGVKCLVPLKKGEEE